MQEIARGVFSVLSAIIGLAILAVIVSRQSNTSGVINSAGGFFNSALGQAVSPITGAGGGGGGLQRSGFGITLPAISFNA